MKLTFDPAKNRTNIRDHEGISLADTEGVFWDECATVIEDTDAKDEQRWIVIGMDGFGRKLVVVYSEVDDGVRVISARKASPNEGKAYDENRIRFFQR